MTRQEKVERMALLRQSIANAKATVMETVSPCLGKRKAMQALSLASRYAYNALRAVRVDK